MIELAALDIAGTTVEEHGIVYEVLREVVTEAGATPSAADVQRWMGIDKREAIAGLVGGADRAATVDVEQLYGRFAARLAARYREQPPQPLPGVVETLAALRSRGVRVALTTGFGRDVAGPLLAILGWTVGGSAADTVDALVCADEVAAGRPAPYLIFRAMERTGVRRVDRVLVAGDTAADLEAGTNAGAAVVVGVGTGGYRLDDLAAAPHTHLLPDVTGILDLL